MGASKNTDSYRNELVSLSAKLSAGDPVTLRITAEILGISNRTGSFNRQLINYLTDSGIVRDLGHGKKEWVGVLSGVSEGVLLGVLKTEKGCVIEESTEDEKQQSLENNNLEDSKKNKDPFVKSVTHPTHLLENKPKTLANREHLNKKCRLVLLKYLMNNATFSEVFFDAFERSDMFANIGGAFRDTGKVFSTFANNSLVDLSLIESEVNTSSSEDYFSKVVVSTIVDLGFLEKEIYGYRWCDVKTMASLVKQLSAKKKFYETVDSDISIDSDMIEGVAESDMDERVKEVKDNFLKYKKSMSDFFKNTIGTKEDFNNALN